jgi:hypothetical protein
MNNIISKNENKIYKISIKTSKNGKIDNARDFIKENIDLDNEMMIKLIFNTQLISKATFRNNHRANKDIESLAPMIFIDVDDESNHVSKIEKCLEGLTYIKKPSSSNKDYKAHFIIFCKGETDWRTNTYQIQVDAFLSDRGINPDWLDTKPLYNLSGYLAPGISKGLLSTEEAVNKSEFVKGELYELINPKEHGIIINENKHGKSGERLKDLPTVEDTGVKIKKISPNSNILEKDSIIYYYGRPVKVSDVVKAIQKESDATTYYSGFGCPICNKEHSSDPKKTPYAFAYLSDKDSDVMFKCSGNECKDKPISIVDKYITYPEMRDNAPMPTEANVRHLLTEIMGIDINFDVIKKDTVYDVPTLDKLHSNKEAVMRNKIYDMAIKSNLSKSAVDTFLAGILVEKEVNPLIDMCKSKEWDKIDRIKELSSCFKCEEYVSDYYRDEGIRRWILQTVACWDYAQSSPIKTAKPKFELIWCLQGFQGAGKTSIVEELLPKNYQSYIATGVMLNLKDKDSIFQAVSCGIAELGELEGTLQKNRIEDFKAFMSHKVDTLRLPYAKDTSNFPRRTSFIGTLNNSSVLGDHTGGRRFFICPILHIDSEKYSAIDKQQLWAQAYYEYTNGQQWWFDRGEEWVKEQNIVNSYHAISTDERELVDLILEAKELELPEYRVSGYKLLEVYKGDKIKPHEKSAFKEAMKLRGMPLDSKNRVKVPLAKEMFDNDFATLTTEGRTVSASNLPSIENIS